MLKLNSTLPKNTFTIKNDTDALAPDNFLLTAHDGEFEHEIALCPLSCVVLF